MGRKLRINSRSVMEYCDRPTEDFWQQYPTITTGEGKWAANHAFVDNGSKVLGVAHLDSVMPNVKAKRHGDIIVSPSLDDRLGVYILLELLPQLGIKLDWLLTDEEECCSSTAQDFQPTKAYNWMIEFDRGGTDVVMYRYHDKKWRKPLAEVGMELGHGSYSDICKLDHLGVTGFNWGTGYNQAHSTRCHANLKLVGVLTLRFAKFYDKYKSRKLKWTAPPTPKWERGGGWREAYGYGHGYGGGMYEDVYGLMTPYHDKQQQRVGGIKKWSEKLGRFATDDELVDAHSSVLEQQRALPPVPGESWSDRILRECGIGPDDDEEDVQASPEELQEIEEIVWQGGELTRRQKMIFEKHYDWKP